jgi:hypothetical protein
MWEGVIAKLRHHEATYPRTNLGIIHFTVREAPESRDREREGDPKKLQNRPEHRGSLQPTGANR